MRGVNVCLAMLMAPGCCCLAADAPADHASILRGMPAALLDRAGGSYPDRDGLVGNNRGGFKAAALQRGATLRLAIHAARGEREKAEDCWRAIDVTFTHQKPEGHFGDPATSVAFWLCELNRSLLVVQQSSLSEAFKPRIETLQPRIRLAAQWLTTQEPRLMKEDAHAPNRLFFDAQALLLSAKLLEDQQFKAPGQRLLEAAMKLYRAEDGVFLERGGGDSSYQAVNLLRLQEILIHYPDPRLEQAVAGGMKWELSRIGADGTIRTEGNTRVRPGGEVFMGKEKTVNVGEVVLALLYYSARTGEAEALKAAQRVVEHYRH